MDKKINDYLHFYLGCEVLVGKHNYKGTLSKVGCADMGEDCEITGENQDEESGFYGESEQTDCEHHRIKPILRKLSSMTHDDIKEWGDNVYITVTPYCIELDSKDECGEFTSVYPDGSILSRSKDDGDIRPINGGLLFRILLSKGFDLFGLIESNLAIDSATLNH